MPLEGVRHCAMSWKFQSESVWCLFSDSHRLGYHLGRMEIVEAIKAVNTDRNPGDTKESAV